MKQSTSSSEVVSGGRCVTYTAVFLDLRGCGAGAGAEEEDADADGGDFESFPFLPRLMDGPASGIAVAEV